MEMKEYIMGVADTGMVSKVVQELVRCKDCKHSTVSENGLIKCGHTFRTEDFFCADGERRTDDA